MRIYDDEQFQAYLKRFQPLAPDPLPATARARRTHPFLGLAAAAALIAFAIFAGVRDWRSVEFRPASIATPARESQKPQPLTLARANALLVQSQSFKTSLDEIALNSNRLKLGQGQQSALGVLGTEKKL